MNLQLYIIRDKYKALRANLTSSQIDDYSLSIANQALKLPIWNKDYYHIYLPITSQKEVNTEYILNILSGKDKHIIISKSDFSKIKLTHFLLTDSTTIKLNSYNIPEPTGGIEIDAKRIDVVFVPLLAFNNLGHRVGYGKGFYDRFLAQCRPETIKIGLSFFKTETLFNTADIDDIKLDICITPECIYQF